MRHGICIIPSAPWREMAPRWRAVEEMGFAHGWTFDHLVWAGRPDAPWFPAATTLTAAATVTTSIKLGTFVASPNFRHPYVMARDVLALDDISDGRFICGLGKGGDVDSAILGDTLTMGDRMSRFEEFVTVLDRLLREDHVDHDGLWYSTRDARTLPGPARDRVPLVLAANGPRAVELAARLGDGWVTTGPQADTLDQWWAGVAQLADRLSECEGSAGMDRYLLLDSSPQPPLASTQAYADLTGRAGELGFTDVITYWPDESGPGTGSLAVLEQVAPSRG